jgi:hypothetical protein
MVTRLSVKRGDEILEPCAGDGVFIDKIIQSASMDSYKIDAFDLNLAAITRLQAKFSSYSNISIQKADILLDPVFGLFSGEDKTYTKVIGNPPYGAWQDHAKRRLLKSIYGGYVKETYTLFIKRCCQLLKNNGRLVFIVPDTFLSLHLHKGLRKYLVQNTKIEEVLLIPSRFFPGISFGYSNLCIITLLKTDLPKDNRIRIVTVEKSINDLYEIAQGNYEVAKTCKDFAQQDIAVLENVDFMIGAVGRDRRIIELVKTNNLRLGDIADCVTGFYSGNNTDFLAVRERRTQRDKKYPIISDSRIEYSFLEKPNIICGLQSDKNYIPILKGAGHDRFVTDTHYFVRWDKKTVNFYRRDRKARFQNSRYYFKEGIGVPMVRGNNLKAYLLGGRLFDQSVVGIFPKERSHLQYLLGFLNSDVCTAMLAAINHTANNSANYLKRIPVIVKDRTVFEINRIMDSYRISRDMRNTLRLINDVFNDLYGL